MAAAVAPRRVYQHRGTGLTGHCRPACAAGRPRRRQRPADLEPCSTLVFDGLPAQTIWLKFPPESEQNWKMDGGRKRKIETRGAEAAEEEQRKRLQAKLGKVHCNYCARDVSDQMYIKSAVSDDVDLCLECFSVGVEINDTAKTDNMNAHRNDNPYRVMERLDFPLITSDWSAREELSLLDGIETHGIGNWVEVKSVVGSKDQAQCQYHYYANYINTQHGKGPVPDLSRAVSKVEFLASAGGGPADSDCVEAAVAGAGPIWGKFTKSEWKNFSRETKHIVRESIRYYEGKPAGSEFVGYMPSRGDFDIEWDNDAEHLICDCVFDDKKDTELDREAKTKVLEIYNWKLEERVRRKHFIIERGLLDFKKQEQMQKRRPKEERELYAKMRLFARFWPQEEHDEYTKALFAERKIREKIKQLQVQRRNGITTFEDAEEFERYQNQRREQQKQDDRVNKQKQLGKSGFSGAPTTGGQERAERARARLQEEEGLRNIPLLDVGLDVPKKPAAFDVKSMPGVDLLSKQEIHLCTTLRLPPADYMHAKDLLIREYLRLGYVRVERAKGICPSVDPHKLSKIYDEIVKAGWLRPNPPSAIEVR